jgi:hypothetical protein
MLLKKMLIGILVLGIILVNLFLWTYLYNSYKKTDNVTTIKSASEIFKDYDFTVESSKSNDEDDGKGEKDEKDTETSSDNKNMDFENNPNNSTKDSQKENTVIENVSSEPERINTKIIDTFDGKKVHNLKLGQHKLVHSSTYAGRFLYWENGNLYSDGDRVQLEADATLVAYDSSGGGEIYRNYYSGSVVGNELHTYSEEGIDIEYKLESVPEEGYQKLKMVLYINVDPLSEANKLYNIKLNIRVIGEGHRTKFTIGSETKPNEDIYINVLENERIDYD